MKRGEREEIKKEPKQTEEGKKNGKARGCINEIPPIAR